ncbi:sigma 54-interacting transcriptional regulator [Selenihalanaerobacter shriftii]|uniref:PAS domain S-box-containing protein n=1 Tax=Selenihalanaerobacter shriftii TaxID=142842 RepID=A0A1T4PIY2_9FIRM|nr:sigma 54-interacting transcriptional regulator [Selenihalanaerobacter shriftii]SJZ91257.1 PAS domain S-box-containing protein [Selenihalanaerobacter shriftii]
MSNKENKICFIAPYNKLKRLADEVIKDRKFPITTIIGDMSEGVTRAKEMTNQGYEVIISRGGTASLIKEAVNLPVVKINVTGYDLLRVLHKYEGCQQRIGIIGYKSVIYGVKAIAEIIGLNIDYYTIKKELEVEEKIKEAINNGIETIIGDTVGVNAAKKYGLDYELIKSGNEAILNGFLEALKVYEATLIEREKKKKLQTILDFAHEGITAVDEEGIVTVFNPTAEKLFNKRRSEVIGKSVEQVIPNTKLPKIIKTGNENIGHVQNIDETKIATNRVPIKVGNKITGAVATFQDVTKIQELEQKIRQKLHKKGLTAQYTLKDIIGNSDKIKNVKKLARKYGKVDSTVLINGESGTGKELFAQGIHNCSDRRVGPFVAVNCAALPTNLLESELFGYEEGTFTGAKKGGKKGLFELAHNGTIFLDEIGEMDKSLQARLLRVIQEKRVMKLGGEKVIPIDVRILAATNRNLREEVRNGRFREDLYYRLSVLDLDIPPLRKRKADIELIFSYLLKKKCKKLNKDIKEVDDDIIEFLADYNWPGNVRELENVIEKIVVISEGNIIKKEDINFILSNLINREDNFNLDDEFVIMDGTLEEIEREIIERTVKREGNKTKAAEKLGIDRTTLWRKLNKWDAE